MVSHLLESGSVGVDEIELEVTTTRILVIRGEDDAAVVRREKRGKVGAAEVGDRVLVGLAVVAVWPTCWWFDPVIGLGIASAAIWQGVKSWRGEDCGC